MLKAQVERTMDAQRYKEWSKKHGHAHMRDTYGDDEDSDSIC